MEILCNEGSFQHSFSSLVSAFFSNRRVSAEVESRHEDTVKEQIGKSKEGSKTDDEVVQR